MNTFSLRMIVAALLLCAGFTAVSFPARAADDPIYRSEIEGTWRAKDGKTLTFTRKEPETTGGATGLSMTQTDTTNPALKIDWDVSYLDGKEFMSLKRYPDASQLDKSDTAQKKPVPDWAKEKITAPGQAKNFRVEWRVKARLKRGNTGILGVLGDRCGLTMTGKATYGQWDWDAAKQTVWTVGPGPETDISEYNKVRYDLPQLSSPPLQLANVSWDGTDDQIDFAGKGAMMQEVDAFMQDRAGYEFFAGYLKAIFDAVMNALPGESIVAKIIQKLVTLLGDVFLSEDGFKEFVKGMTNEILKSLIGKAPDIMKPSLEKLSDKASDDTSTKVRQTTDANWDALGKYMAQQCAIKIVILKPPPSWLATRQAKLVGGIAIVDTVEGTAKVRLFLAKNASHGPAVLESNIGGLSEKGKPWNLNTHIYFHRIEMQ